MQGASAENIFASARDLFLAFIFWLQTAFYANVYALSALHVS